MSAINASIKNIGVFCGSRAGASPAYVDSAKSLGMELAKRGAGLVYGAGGVGVMGALAAAALGGGARVTGVIPHDLYERERPDLTQGEIYVARTMHERKALMYRLSDGFAVLPGGFGTLDEVMEVATWNQLGFHTKPVVLINCDGYYDPLLTLLDHMVTQGFISLEERALLRVAENTHDALDQLGWPAAPNQLLDASSQIP
ncbi:TIGR00730 family Rossman fold protein [Streptomyces sp. NPDC004111]|uniref:LOG family protein n=1 Tax=Streptomyces sp. NPDC004111 TaxID=3364690 RepID=UPI0036AA4651